MSVQTINAHYVSQPTSSTWVAVSPNAPNFTTSQTKNVQNASLLVSNVRALATVPLAFQGIYFIRVNVLSAVL